MIRICIVNIPSCDRATRVDPKGVGTVVRTRDVTGVRRIERGEGAIPIQQKTVTYIVRVEVVSHDDSTGSKASAICTLLKACAGAWNIEGGNDAVPITQETVAHIGSVKIVSRDRSGLANRVAKRTLAWARARARNVKRGDGAILLAQKTVPDIRRVHVIPCDRPAGVNDEGAERKGTLAGARARAWRIEDGNHALIGANVAVGRID